MPTPMIYKLWADPAYRALSPGAQMVAAERYVGEELNADPVFQALPFVAKQTALRKYILEAVTFDDDGGVGQLAKTYAVAQLGGQQNVAGGIYEGALAIAQNSGIVGLIDKGMSALAGVTPGDADRRRALEFLQAAHRMSGQESKAQTVGALLGTLADVAGVSLVMSPLTGAAAKGIGALARGGTKAVQAAAAAGKAAPIVSRSLAVLGPIASEAAIEAIPYLIVEDQRRTQNGETSIFAEDALTVARTLGQNAAIDFLAGAALTGVAAAAKGALQIFFKKGGAKLAYADEEGFQRILTQVRTGGIDPVMLERLKVDQPITFDRVQQSLAIDNYLREGVLDPAAYRWDKASYLAHDLSTVVGKLDDGTYRLWDMMSEGRPTFKTYETLEDLEDTLSFAAYKKWESLPVEDQDRFLSAHTNWALPRGKVLADQGAMLGSPTVSAADPILAKASTPVPPISKRPMVTQGEAQALTSMTTDTSTVVQAQVPLKGSITRAANAGDLDLNRAAGPIQVTPHDQPNAVFVGAKVTPPEVYEAATAKALKAVDLDPSLTMEQARASILMDLGFDHARLPDGSVEFFTGRNMKLIGTPDLITAAPVKPTTVGQVSNIAVVASNAMFRGGSEALRGNEDLLMSAAQKALRSQSDTDLRNFARLYASSSGADPHVIVRRSVDAMDVHVAREGNTITIHAPVNLGSFADENKFLSDLLKGLDSAVTKGPPSKASAYWGEKFARRIQAFQLPVGSNPVRWASDIATRLGGKLDNINGKFALSLPSGNTVFATIDDAVTVLSRRLADDSIVKFDMARQGIRITSTKSGFRATTIRDGRLLATSPDMPSLLDRLDYTPSSLDLAYGPKVVGIGDSSIDFEVAGNLSYRTPEEAFRALQKFKDTRLITQKKLLSAKAAHTLSELPGSRYEVYLGEYGARRSFSSLVEARSFMSRADDLEISELRSIMHDKYGDLTIENGRYIVRIGPSRYTAGSLTELKDIMKRIPDVSENAPRILDEIDPMIESSVTDIVNQQRLRFKYRAGPNPYGLAPEFEFDPHAVQLDAFDVGRSAFANFTGWIEDISKKYDIPPLASIMAKLRDGKRLADISTNDANKTLRTIFTGPNGKLLSTESRQRIFYHLAGQSAEDAAALATQYRARYGSVLAPLSPVEEGVALHLREFLKAAGDRFGIAYEKLIFNYMPKLRDLTEGMNRELLENLTTGDELLRNLPNYQAPKEIKFWAEHERLDEITRFWLKDDALEVVQLYMAQGSKKALMNEPWKELYRFIQTAKLGEDITTRVNAYRMDLMSSYHTPAEKTVEQFGSALFRGIKNLPGVGKLIPYTTQEMEKMGSGILNHLLSLVYFSSMGWKPFLAIRNAMQPLTMTAPRVGVDWVLRAYDDVLKRGDEIYDSLIRRGVLSEKPPIVNSPFTQDNLLSRVSERSLAAFKNSDDLTRAVAYRSGEMRFDNAAGLWDTGRIRSRPVFESAAGLDVMDDTTRNEAWALFSSGDPMKREAAKDLFANKLQRDSMFDYSGSDSPMIHRGVIGRLFGQFGSYSSSYRANVSNMFKYGSLPRKIEMVATYLAMTSLLYAGFEGMRVKTSDFIPFAPTFFGGGPLADMTWNAIKSTGSGYEAEQARAALLRDLPVLIPGSMQAKYAKKALDYAAQGDSYAAWLSLMGTSVKPLW